MRPKILFLLLSLCLVAGVAHAELGVYVSDLDVFARANLGDYKVQLGARFGTSSSQVDFVLSNVDRPADAAIVLWLGDRCRQPLDRVLRVYRSHKSKGWGEVAKGLGIKPGSAEFHALKAGNLDFSPSKGGGSKTHRTTKDHDKDKGKKKHD